MSHDDHTAEGMPAFTLPRWAMWAYWLVTVSLSTASVWIGFFMEQRQ